jgi:hypothetical protein
MLGKGFTKTRVLYVQMFSRLERLLPGRKTYEMLNAIDNRLFTLVPFLQRYAREAIIELVK